MGEGEWGDLPHQVLSIMLKYCPFREMCFSMATITSVGHLISIYRPSTMDRTIDALGNTKKLENGAFTLKFTLYLGRQNIYWKIHK